ncbi:MAG TPA: YitT family protein [Symbiobacteriaceae bacterium]|nr:YitT family protein [Symbiobacteriaceae bacterium]
MWRGSGIVAGAVLVGAGLELFLIPNQIIDGGVVGVAIMTAHLTGWPVGAFLFLLNLPFLWLGYKQIGKTFALTTLGAVVLMSSFVSSFARYGVLTEDPLLAAVFGGAVLGLGVGIIIRNGGSLDGTEIVAIMLTKRWPFSVGEIVMGFNLFILGSAAFVFGWDRAMYSLLAYFVAFRTIDIAIEGLEESKSATIITEAPADLRAAIIDRLGRGVTELEGKGGYSGAPKGVLFTVITRLELAKLKAIVLEVDPEAFVAIEDVHEVLGGRRWKRAIH